MDQSPILILFANLKGNLGDHAILHAMLRDISREHPECPIHVMSHGQHVIDEKRWDAFQANTPHPFRYLGKTPFLRMPAWTRALKRIGLRRWVSGKWVAMLETKYARMPAIENPGQYQAFYFAGGEQWSGSAHGMTMFAILSLVAKCGRPVRIFPFSTKAGILKCYPIPLLETLFSSIDGDIPVRDSHSLDTLSRISPRAKLVKDTVFSLHGEVAANPPEPETPDRLDIIIAVTESTGSKRADVIAAARALLRQGHRVRFLSTCEREDGTWSRDLAAATETEALFPDTWQDAVRTLGTAHVVIANRLHCLIFTCLAGTIPIPLLDREKMIGIHRDIGLPLGLRNISELHHTNLAEWTPNAAPECREKIAAYLRED